MKPNDLINENDWLRAMGLEPGGSARPGGPGGDAENLHRLLQTLRDGGDTPQEILDKTEAAWRADSSAAPIALAAPARPARRVRWARWTTLLAAAAALAVLLVRPFFPASPPEWRTAVALAVVRGEAVERRTSEKSMHDWLGRLEKEVWEELAGHGYAGKCPVDAVLSEDPDGTLMLRLSLSHGEASRKLDFSVPGPPDGPAAGKALRGIAEEIARVVLDMTVSRDST